MAKVAAEVGSTANSYQILGKLAVGGMAEIFLTRGAGVAGVERYCVLKRILREHASDAQFVQMFLDEARLAAQLQHPNIASVYDIGMLGDSYFFTMEYVHGETVRSLLSRALELRRPLPLACVLTIIAGTAAGLHHAHERNGNDGRPLGIVHRDVTPSNVMVSYEGNVKVVDFGVAKAADREVQTKSGTVKGKISYLSPEQCRGVRVDRRSDMFSLGIVMWEMLTCARLYQRDSDFESMTAIVKEPPPPPSSRRRDVPRAVDEIVLRLLAKSVTDRFQSAAEVVEAIENASARAGTILSTSAVSRLIRDLFGTRAEPWLVLDGDTQPHQPITLGAKPIPQRLAPADGDSVEIELAGVRDLSSSSISTGSGEDAPEQDVPAPTTGGAEPNPELPPARAVEHSPGVPVGSVTPPGAVRPPRRMPAFAPASMAAPMTLRSLPPPPRAAADLPAQLAHAARAHVPASAAQPERPAAAIPVRVKQPAPPTPVPDAPPGRGSQPAIPALSSLSAAHPVAPAAPPPHAAIPSPSPLTGSDRIAVPAAHAAPIPSVAPTVQARFASTSPLLGSPSIPARLGTSPPQPSDETSSPVSTPITRLTELSSLEVAIPASRERRQATPGVASAPARASQRASRSSDASLATTMPRMREARGSRISRRLIAFCILAAGIGVAAALLSARMRDDSSADRAVTPVADTRPVEDAGVRQPSAEVVSLDAATALESHDANDTATRSEIDGHDANEASDPGAASSSTDAGAAGPVIAPPAVHRHHRHPRPSPGAAATPPAVADAAPPGAAADASLAQSPAPSDPARPAADDPRPQSLQATETPAPGLLKDLFHLKEYAAVVDHCSQMNVTADIASVCVLAACYIQASDKAKLWLSKMPDDQQPVMENRCNQLGSARGSAASSSGAGAGSGSAGG